jgi:hypothetical protein
MPSDSIVGFTARIPGLFDLAPMFVGRKILLLGWAIGGLATAASAEVVSTDAGGFTVKGGATVSADPSTTYEALLDVWKWWDPAHTWSGDASNLSIDARAGGCFCEALPEGGSVQHMEVVYAAHGSTLRMRGALGPLQEHPVAGSLTWTLAPAGEGCEIGFVYRVSGRVEGGIEAWAGPVDFVLSSQLARLAALLDGD